MSLLTGAIVPANVAMTGEVLSLFSCISNKLGGANDSLKSSYPHNRDSDFQMTLRGRVTPVGGIKEKVSISNIVYHHIIHVLIIKHHGTVSFKYYMYHVMYIYIGPRRSPRKYHQSDPTLRKQEGR